MSFNVAVTSPQKAQLRVEDRAWQAEQVIVPDPNVIVLAGQLNENTSTSLTWAQFTYNNVTAGSYTDVIADQAILIGNSGDIKKATYRGRVRSATNTVIEVNESSADFVVGNYFWILDTYDITDRLARLVGNDIKKDWGQAYQGMRPLVRGLQTGYYNSIPHPVTGKYRFTFTVTAQDAQSGGSIASYLYRFKTGTYTVISGSLSSATVTVDLDAGWQWGHLEIVNAAGVKLVRHFAIAADDGTLASAGFDGATITGNLQAGFNASVKAFDGVDDLLDNTFVIIARRNETTGNVTGPAVGSTVDFVGWIRHEDNQAQMDAQHGATADVTFEIAGVSARLSKLEGQLIAMMISATPAAYDYIKQLTVWRAIYHFFCEHTTGPNLCAVEFDDTGLDFLYPDLVTQEGKALGNMQGLANQINALIEFAPDGRIYIGREAGYLYAAGRNALTKVIDYTEDDIIGTPQLGHQRAHDKTIGKVDAVGSSYQTADGSTPGYEARAPGHAQDSADGSETLPNQVLKADQDEWAAKNELKYRAANKQVIANNSEVLSVSHPDSYYSWLVPSGSQWYTFTLDLVADGMVGVGRVKLDNNTRWTLESITYTHDNSTGTRTGSCTYRKEPPFGDPGDDTTPVPQGSIEDVLPAIPPIEAFAGFDDFNFPDAGYLPAELPMALLTPPKGQVARFDGNETIVWDATHIWVSKTFIMLRSPKWIANTPEDLGSFEIKMAIWDRQYTKNSVGAYALGSNGTNSAIWYTPNAFQSGLWVKGAEFAGVYTKIWGTDTAGQVMVHAANQPGTGPINFTYIKGSGPSSADVGDTFTVTSATDGDVMRVALTPDACVHMQVLASSGWTTVPYGTANAFPSSGNWNIVHGTQSGNVINDDGTGQVEVEFMLNGAGTLFTGLSASAYVGNGVGLFSGWRYSVKGYDASNTLIVTYHNEGPNTFFDGFGSQTFIGDSATVAGIKKIVFRLSITGGPASLYLRLPTVTIDTAAGYLWYYKDCGGSTVNGPAFPTDQLPTSFPTIPGVSEMGVVGDSGSAFTLQLKVLAKVGIGNAEVRATADYGVTVSSAITVGAPLDTLVGGFDIIPVKGGVSLAASHEQVKHATTIGGAYSNVSGGGVSGAEPVMLEMPYSRWSADATVQYNTSDPDFAIGLNKLLSGYCLYRVAGATGVQTGITLTGATAVVGPNAFTSYFSQNFAVLAFVAGVSHLFTSANAGTSTTDRGAVTGAVYVRVRYKAKRFGQLFICGGSLLKYTSNGGVSLWPRTPPVSSGLLGIEVLG